MKYNGIAKMKTQFWEEEERKVIKVDNEGSLPTEVKTVYICLNPIFHLNVFLHIMT